MSDIRHRHPEEAITEIKVKSQENYNVRTFSDDGI